MSKLVLMVEDSATQAQVITKMLEAFDAVIERAASHAEAIEKLVEKPFDLLLLDVFLENDNSLDHLAEYKALRPDLMIAVMTAGGEAEDASISGAVNRARRANTDFILAKPFGNSDLKQLFDELDSRQLNASIRIEPGTVFLR